MKQIIKNDLKLATERIKPAIKLSIYEDIEQNCVHIWFDPDNLSVEHVQGENHIRIFKKED